MSANTVIRPGLTVASLTLASLILVAGCLILVVQGRMPGIVTAHPPDSDLQDLSARPSTAPAADRAELSTAAPTPDPHGLAPWTDRQALLATGLNGFGPAPALSLAPVGPAISLAPAKPVAMSPRLLDLSDLTNGTCRPLTATAICP